MAITLDDFIKLINWPIIHIGEVPVTFGGIGSAVIIFLCAMLMSIFIQRIMVARLKMDTKMTNGMIFALRRIVHYTFIFLGIIVSSQCVGLNFSSLAVIFGFLGVGIGFGLQNLTSNFISGIILLFERPINVGDLVDVDGKLADVISINMRSTVVRTFDNITIIVPNAKFIENSVINWTVDDPRMRLHCPVGVAYGSDIAKVKEVLLDIAQSNEKVLKTPSPEVRFLEFGESALNFELLVWVADPSNQKILRSEINYAIDKAFREHGISIPFPQRDLHLKLTPEIEKISEKFQS